MSGGYECLKDGDFWKALECFEDTLRRDNTLAEAYWGEYLCEKRVKNDEELYFMPRVVKLADVYKNNDKVTVETIMNDIKAEKNISKAFSCADNVELAKYDECITKLTLLVYERLNALKLKDIVSEVENLKIANKPANIWNDSYKLLASEYEKTVSGKNVIERTIDELKESCRRLESAVNQSTKSKEELIKYWSNRAVKDSFVTSAILFVVGALFFAKFVGVTKADIIESFRTQEKGFTFVFYLSFSLLSFSILSFIHGIKELIKKI